jgi:Glycosyl transferase family 11
MIAVDKRGQLGNQMFQYAFAAAAARRLSTTFRYDVSDLAPHFTLLQPSGRGLVFRRREIITDDRDDPDDVFATLTDRTRYGGYFYGYGYVRHAADAGRAFTVHPEIGSRFHRRYGGLVAGGYICCHARLTDFFTYRDNVTLAPGYYRRALDVIDTDRPVVFVSDDIAMVAATLDGLPGARFEETDAVTALLLLSHASAVVSSNSSLSWWGSWLNDRPGLHVIAPRWWLGVNEGAEFPVRAIPPSWHQIPARTATDGTWAS